MSTLSTSLKTAYRLTNDAKFVEAVEKFRSILYAIPFVILSGEEEKEVVYLLRVSLEYIFAISCELQKQNASPAR